MAHFAPDDARLWSVSCGPRMPNHGGFVPVNNNIGKNMDIYDLHPASETEGFYAHILASWDPPVHANGNLGTKNPPLL